MLNLPDMLRRVLPSSSRFLFASRLAIVAILAFAVTPTVFAQDGPWQRLGPPGGHVISLVASPSNIVYLGAADGHVFVLSDGGKHWLLRGRVSSRRDAVIQKLLIDSRNEKHLLAAVWFQDIHEGGALYRSSDAGATWTVAGLSGEIVRTVEQSASAPEMFFAGSRNGVFRSTDSAQTWRRISPAGDPELRNVDSLAVDPRDAQIIYAGTYHLPWKTSDGGQSWFPIAAGMIDDSDVMSLRIDAANPQRIFASACSGIYRSENAAAAWIKLQGIPYSSRRTQAMAQDPADPRIVYAATTEGLWLTRDAGESWARTTPRDWIVNAVVVLPTAGRAGASTTVFLGTEALGVLVSTDGGATFSPANEGFSHRVAAALVGDPLQPEHLLSWMPGSPDPLIESRDGGAQWQTLPGPAPADIVRIFSTASKWWLASASAGFSAYDASHATWNHMRFVAMTVPVRRAPLRTRHGPPPARQKTSAQLPAASDISAVFAVGARVFVASTQGLWSGTADGKILRPVALSDATELGAEDFAAGVLWLVAGGRVIRSMDGGQTWIPAVLHLDTEDPGITANPALWIAALPPASNVLEQNTRLLLVGTLKGLYRRAPNSAAWQSVQNGLPAGAPVAYSIRHGVWLVALRSGGLYVSRDVWPDAPQTWDRLDTAADAGQFTGATITSDGRIVVASLTEGLLRYSFPEVH